MSWQSRAACTELDPDMFTHPARYHEGIAVCQICPVIAQCREFGRKQADDVVWGGYVRARGGRPPKIRPPRKPKLCKRCEQPVAADRGKSIYCSEECRHKRVRVCSSCGVEFTNRTRNRCCLPCRRKARASTQLMEVS